MLNNRRAGPTTRSEPSVERHIEIACDESGFSGGNLVGGGHSPVFAHASVRIESEPAGELVQHLRRENGARGDGEYKSPEILRPRRRPIVLWLLGPSSPIHGNAHVHLTDTRFFVLARLLDVLLSRHAVRGIACPGRNPLTRPMALALYRSGEQSYGTARCRSSSLCRPISSGPTTGGLLKTPVPMFYAAAEAMTQASAAANVPAGDEPVAIDTARRRSNALVAPSRTPSSRR